MKLAIVLVFTMIATPVILYSRAPRAPSTGDGKYNNELTAGLQGTSTISGQCFFDLNKNGVKDPGEPGIPNVNIEAFAINGVLYAQGGMTDSNGNYSMILLPAGTYIVSAMPHPDWIQTLPPSCFTPILVTLDSAAHRTGADFGFFFEAVLGQGFRSFVPDSLALAWSPGGSIHQTHLGSPVWRSYNCQMLLDAEIQNVRDQSATSLQLKFENPFLDSLLVLPPPVVQTISSDHKSFLLDYPDGISFNSFVHVHGVWSSRAHNIFPQNRVHVTWTYPTKMSGNIKQKVIYNWTMLWNWYSPNAVDVLLAMKGHSIRIGMPRNRPNSNALSYSHTVFLTQWERIVNSLRDQHNVLKTGPPRCLCGPGLQGQVTTRTILPFSHNMLYTEAVALKVNMLASDLQITPAGFGDLIFDEGGDNPLNGKSIRSIAGVLDDYMSSWAAFNYCHMPAGYEQLDSMRLFQTIRKIDSAFSGPIEYSSWVPDNSHYLAQAKESISLYPVRSLDDVPYLHIDTTNSGGNTTPLIVENAVPERFALWQNYPNPFNPATTIGFSLPCAGQVTLKIYNLLGQEVATVLNREDMDEGDQEIDFNASHLASGVYFYRLEATSISDPSKTFTQVRKMILLK